MRLNNYLNETTMSRVFSHFKNKDRAVLIMSAFRDEYSDKENLQRNKQLAAKIKKSGFGYVYVDGHWIPKG